MSDNIVEVRYGNPEQDTILVLKEVDGGYIEEVIEPGSPAHKELEDLGYDHERILDDTAEYKKVQLANLRESLKNINYELYKESIEYYEDKLLYLNLQLVRSQALAKKTTAEMPARLKAVNEYIAKNLDHDNVNASFDAMLSFLRVSNSNEDVVNTLKERVSKDSKSQTIIDLLKELL